MSTCPYCLRKYTLGVTGTIKGCDECLGVIRNVLDGTVIEDDFADVFEDDEDTLTDMEKA